ncbi:MAG: YopX family protein [Enterococcus faecalis]|nr:YopX family protein [Enterococcus faecalis]MDU3437608.1 YopX family protein [Enterococcus faecalis]MDU3446837.1 YopX family protein [Enterococcus faecalis]MDU4368853.1 YopX family protein [Enterococcus faecalis]DAF82921.1 MAG TPA: YopX protein [Caudoviricetes sp.]
MIPKFRAWDKKYKKMMKVNQIDFEKKTVWLEADNGDHENRHTLTREFKDVILMQSTGLKDKNGVEIFEGDIVQYRDGEYSYLGIVKRDCYQFLSME